MSFTVTEEDFLKMESQFVWQEEFNIGVESIDRDHQKLFKIIKMLYGLMGLPFSGEAEPMDADPAVLEKA